MAKSGKITYTEQPGWFSDYTPPDNPRPYKSGADMYSHILSGNGNTMQNLTNPAPEKAEPEVGSDEWWKNWIASRGLFSFWGLR